VPPEHKLRLRAAFAVPAAKILDDFFTCENGLGDLVEHEAVADYTSRRRQSQVASRQSERSATSLPFHFATDGVGELGGRRRAA